MDTLPNEIINVILFEYLSNQNIKACMLTSKLFHVLTRKQHNAIKKAYNLDTDPISCIYQCIAFGYLDTCQWIYNLNIPELQKILESLDMKYYRDAFKECCINGNLETLKWLNELYLQKFKNKCIPDRLDNCFTHTCTKGNTDIAKWLHANYTVDIYYDNDYAFNVSCQDGKFEIVQWLYSMSCQNNKPYDLHNCVDYPFRWSCANGHLLIAQWVYNVAIGNGSPYQLYYSYFEESCTYGHLDVSQWLYDLSLKNNSPFKITNELFDKIRSHDNHIYLQYNNNKNNKHKPYPNDCLNVMKWLYQIADELDICLDISLCQYNLNNDIKQWYNSIKRIQIEENNLPNKKPKLK